MGQEGVQVTVELCFESDGQLSGVEKASGGEDENDYFLVEGEGVYACGDDRITFGPGRKEHERIRGLDGEKYSVHFGGFPAEGQRVFITGYTPFTYSLSFA